ncbi:MAG: hypothetical protein ABH950_08330 [Candidatus Altiarchaeota archaeon]
MSTDQVTAVAYPGLPFIFAEGIREPFDERISEHNSVGLALTDLNEEVRTETTIRKNPSSKEDIFLVNGKKVEGDRAKGMFRIVRILKEKGKFHDSLLVSSKNYNIVSGSSDSGAAAFITALDEFLGTKLSLEDKLSIGRFGSETVFRSLCGGLTEYIVDEAPALKTKQIASPERLADIVIYAIPFTGERRPADIFHNKIQNHPHFLDRKNEVKERIGEVKKCFQANNFISLLSVMEKEATTFHKMAEELGIGVLTNEMKEVTRFAQNLRLTKVPVYWTCAAGLQVYLATTKEYRKEVETQLLAKKIGYRQYKAAGEAHSINAP